VISPDDHNQPASVTPVWYNNVPTIKNLFHTMRGQSVRGQLGLIFLIKGKGVDCDVVDIALRHALHFYYKV
jgi:hypothetical protein